MSRFLTCWASIVLACGLCGAEEPAALSPRNASYEIRVKLDVEQKTLEGRQVLTWRNIQEQPADELWFHLYWNAWRNDRSTWMLGDRVRERSGERERKIREEDWSWIEIDSVRLLGETPGEAVDLTAGLRFAFPDDGNAQDRTVQVATLPEPVPAGETVRVEMVWRAKIPRTFARTGYRGEYFFLAHWFPKLGVYEADGWNCHQYHSSTEYYSDFGVYDVEITLPKRFLLGATGRETSRRENADGTATYSYYQEDVHAFTWTASPDYVERTARFDVPGLPPIDMRLLIQPEHLWQTERHFDAARAAFESYGRWYGPYPYGHVTLIDPAFGSGAGGMEYPTLFTCGTRLFNPRGIDSPESVTIHEAGHQFWYGIVGNNEFDHAWLDEGLNTFSTVRTLNATYDEPVLVERYLKSPSSGRRAGRGFFPVRFRDITVPRWARRHNSLRESADSDDPRTPSYLYYPSSGGDITYSKTALWLETLERHLGWPTLQGILSTFFERHRFGHPTPEDFFAVANEVAGQDLSWFFDQVYEDSVTFDYEIQRVDSVPVMPEGLVGDDGVPTYVERDDEDKGEEKSDTLFRTEVVVHRKGDGRFPVDVLLVFEDGHEIRETWNGQDRRKTYVVQRMAKLDHAIVDPDRVLMLDPNYTDNSRILDAQPGLPASKWAAKWMIWLQDLLSAYAFFI